MFRRWTESRSSSMTLHCYVMSVTKSVDVTCMERMVIDSNVKMISHKDAQPCPYRQVIDTRQGIVYYFSRL